MKNGKIKLTQLEPADYNPRQISDEEMKKLKNSIRQFGLADPIVINTNNNRIISGHQRYEALLDIYMEDGLNIAEEEFTLICKGDIGFVLTEKDLEIIDDDHEKALNLAFNKISGEWNTEKLAPLLEELNLSELDVELTGFEDWEIEDLFFDVDDDLDEDIVDRSIEEAFNSIFEGLEENESLKDGISDNRIISFYTSDEDLFMKFLLFLDIEPSKLNKKRNIRLEDLECLKE